MSEVKHLTLPPVEVTPTMKAMAVYLRQLADDVDGGKVRAVAVTAVESGPDMFVTNSWECMSGRTTLTGGLFRLTQLVGNY